MNLLTLQNISAQPYGSNYPLWSLAIEMHIYVVYPLLFALRRRIGLSGSVAVIALVNLLSLAITIPSNLIIFTNYLGVWWMGAIVAERSDFITGRIWFWAGLVCIAAGCVLLQANNVLAFQLGGLGFAALLSGCLRMKAIASFGWPLISIGRLSYSLYLIHLPVLVLIVSAIYAGVRPQVIYPCVAGVLVSIVVAYVLYLLVERGSVRLASSPPARLLPGLAERASARG